LLQIYNNIFEIRVKNTFRGAYCNHQLNFAVDLCYESNQHSNKLFHLNLTASCRKINIFAWELNQKKHKVMCWFKIMYFINENEQHKPNTIVSARSAFHSTLVMVYFGKDLNKMKKSILNLKIPYCMTPSALKGASARMKLIQQCIKYFT